MQRRGESERPVKGQRTKKPKARDAPTAPVSPADLQKQLDRLTRERDEALERETATSEILRIISNSPTDLQSALGAIAESVARLLDVAGAEILRVEGDGLRLMAKHGALAQRPVGSIRPINRGLVIGRAVIDRTTVQVLDLQAAEREFPEGAASARQYGHRTTLATPLLREGTPIGGILIRRMEVRPFTDKQIALLQNFAGQAAIAIENTRLLKELRQRTGDLSESLEQQTATSEVLKVISSSPGELEPVFEAMLENAVRICGAKFGMLYLSEGDGFRTVATHDVPRAFAEKRAREPFFYAPAGSPMGRVTRTRQVAHIADITTEQGYAEGNRALRDLAELGGARTVAAVPMLKDDKLVGAIVIYRQEPRPFTDKQIELVQNFAAQAVIAIENTRLLNELRESLEQQTATSAVLKVISSSPGELEPVFNAMLENAVRICQAKFGVMHRFVGEEFYSVAHMNLPQALDEFLRQRGQAKAIPGSDMDNLCKSKQVVHTFDMLAMPVPSPPARLAGGRTQLAVPMLMEGELIGAIVIYRQEVLPFTDKQIELVKNFAAQAVIAIENTRLLSELRESLQQQTATADVLKVISRSAFDLQVVFDTLVGSAVKLCEAENAFIYLRDGDIYRLAANHGFSREFRGVRETASTAARTWHPGGTNRA